MSELAQFIQDFDRRQQQILAAYRLQQQSLQDDQKTLIRLLLLQQKGLSVIDQGDLISKTQLGQTITNLPTINASNIGGGLTVRILDLKGAKMVRIMAGADFNGGSVIVGPYQVTGILGYFSTIPNDTPVDSDFAFLGESSFSQSTAYGVSNQFQDLTWNQYAEIPCATAKWLYMVFPITIAETDGWAEANNDFPEYATYQLLG